MTFPSVHLNGSSPEYLREAYVDAANAIMKALDALALTAPNGRDYYPQGDAALKKAVAEHVARATKLREVRAELMDLTLYVQDQIDGRKRR